jgi:SSS family solute:Na+ symporter
LWIVHNIYFQYYSLLIFVVSALVMIAVSFMTAAPADEKIQGLTYGTVTEDQSRESRSSWSAIDILSSAAVLAAIIVAYAYFSG